MKLFNAKSTASLLILFIGYVLAYPSTLNAEVQGLDTDRPDQTESSATVPQGYTQLEMGWLHSEGGSSETDVLAQALLRYGLTENLEFRFIHEGYFWEDGEGSGDIALGMKVSLWQEDGWLPQAALITHLGLPTGQAPFSSERVDPDYRFAFTHTLSERMSLAYNLGQAWKSEVDSSGDRDTRPDFQYTTALAMSMTDKLGCFVELFGDIATGDSDGPANSLDGGFTYMLKENLQLDVYSGVGLSDEADDWFIGAGFSILLP